MHGANPADALPAIQLFGPPLVMVNQQCVTHYHSQRVAALVFLLAAADAPQPRAALAALLWESADASKANANLSKGLYHLPPSLKPFLTTERAIVALRLPADAVDTRTFSRLCRDATTPGLDRADRVAALADAAELYRGDFLQGFCLEGAARFNAWLAAERQRYRLLAAQVHGELLAHYVACQAHLQAIYHATALLTLDKTDEATYRQLMQLLVQHGQMDAAAAVYRACCDALRLVRHAPPSDETIALAVRLHLQPSDSPPRQRGDG